MKKTVYLAGILAAGILFIGGSAVAQAEDGLKVSGYVDNIFTIMDDATDDLAVDADGKAANKTETKFFIAGEVDFEYTAGPVVTRLDLDVPSIGNEAAGYTTPVAGDIGIEQAKFEWMIPGAEVAGLKLTGGAFNAPIGFEAQDAPDLYQTTNGQLWGLVPSNLAGLMVSGGSGPVAVDAYFVNEWTGATSGDALLGEENSYGALLTVTPIEVVSLSAAYLGSTGDIGDEDIFDLVLTGNGDVAPNINALLSGEFLKDKNNTAFAIVGNVMFNGLPIPLGLTGRFDSVDCNKDSFYCGGEATQTSITVAGTAVLAENLSTLVEWNTFDPDVPGVDSTSQLLWEFVTTFD